MASDADGRAYVVLNTDPTLTAAPVAEQRLRPMRCWRSSAD